MGDYMNINDKVIVIKMHIFKRNEELNGTIVNINTRETSDMFGDDGIETTFCIKLKNGKEIKVTYNHLGNMVGSYPYKIKNY